MYIFIAIIIHIASEVNDCTVMLSICQGDEYTAGSGARGLAIINGHFFFSSHRKTQHTSQPVGEMFSQK